MKCLLLAFLICLGVPLAGQGILAPETPQSRAIEEFQQAINLCTTLEYKLAPTFAEFGTRLLIANPEKSEAVDRAVTNEQKQYFDMILKLSSTVSLNFLDRLSLRLQRPVEEAALRAAHLADRPEFRKFDAEVPLEASICFIKQRYPGCEVIEARLQKMVAAGGDDLKDYAALRIASWADAMAMIQLSIDSGSPMALVERRFVAAEGLSWPCDEG